MVTDRNDRMSRSALSLPVMADPAGAERALEKAAMPANLLIPIAAASREARFQEILGEYDTFAPGELEEHEGGDSLVFSIDSGILSDEVLHRSKSLMSIEPSTYSTIIVQLGKVATPNLGELDREKYEEYAGILESLASEIQAEIDFENLAPHIKRFVERTDKLGVERPDIVDAEFENYLIALIRYVNFSVSRRQKG